MHEDPTRADVRAENARVASPAEEFGEAYEPWIIELGELDEKMGVVVEEQSAERVVATMPVEGNRQSLGLLHGGASVALGEMLGSWAAVIHGSTMGKVAVGVDINATHHASATSGRVRGVATAIHLGRSVTNHEVVITHIDTGQRLCTVRITNYLKPAKRS
ncbi:hotdog fold thioesterase [Kocuria marina]|uniref:hotdog fold thioesterase n=1 Tax=Kocuria TaxID=57493 RepID=UPI0007EA309A|nr:MULTISPECIES: hotdog fold thioesterase [Kocuria]MCT1723768.1 hotdog fold thioesterase [Kocuria marina]MCT1733690.1 hotdog fold thioesterase [Kocuria marina]OBA47761.1 thioesterase [Kocuria sp. ICS0012]